MAKEKKVVWGVFVGALLFMALLFAISYAAAPLSRNFSHTTATFTVDAQQTGGWDIVDSLIIVCSDSAATIITVSGTAILDPGDKLYLGMGNDSANMTSAANLTAYSNLIKDSIIYPKNARGSIQMPFTFRYVNTTNGANTDTLYFNAACGGSTVWEYVYLRKVYITAMVADQ